MDPNAALEEIRQNVRYAMTELDNDEDMTLTRGEMFSDLLNELVDKFDGLDGWLSRGGFLPEAWQR